MWSAHTVFYCLSETLRSLAASMPLPDESCPSVSSFYAQHRAFGKLFAGGFESDACRVLFFSPVAAGVPQIRRARFLDGASRIASCLHPVVLSPACVIGVSRQVQSHRFSRCGTCSAIGDETLSSYSVRRVFSTDHRFDESRPRRLCCEPSVGCHAALRRRYVLHFP